MLHWLATNSTPARVDVIWLPMLESDDRAAAVAAMNMFRDARVVQFWDPDRHVGTRWSVEFQVAHGRALLDSLPPDVAMRPDVEAWVASPASQVMWDVAYFYPRGERWRVRIPAPIAWTKQIGFWAEEDSLGSAPSADLVTGRFWCDRRPQGSVESDWFREFAHGMSRITPGAEP